MIDQWRERLSAYVDHALPESTAAELEQHLRQCLECRRAVDDLRAVVRQAQALEDRAPEADLWPAIAARIGQESGPRLRIVDATERKNPARRRFAFTLPQLAAAAITLMLLSGSLVWAILQPSQPGSATAGTPAAPVRQVSRTPATVRQYGEVVAQLESALRARRDRLDPATVAVLEQNLEAIDAAIAEARAALENDPNNLYLNRHLENTLKKKIQLLRRATTLGGVRI